MKLKNSEDQDNWNDKKKPKSFKELMELFETPWDRLVDSLRNGNLSEALKERGIIVNTTARNVKGWKEEHYVYDIIAMNGNKVVVVQVRMDLEEEHVNCFLEDMKKFNSRISIFKNQIIYGAVAYLKTEKEAIKYAENQGLFVIKATEKNASIINKKDFKPKVFS